jgi:hypothetical protein
MQQLPRRSAQPLGVMTPPSQAPDSIEEAWVRDYLRPRYPELVAPYLEAFQITEKAKLEGELSQAALTTLLVHAKSRRTPLGENVAGMLGRLYEVHPHVGEAIRALASGGSVHERINALVALDSCSTAKLHVELFAAALTDRSARVRALAADKIVGHGIGALREQLEAAHQRETKPELKAELATQIEWLTKGFSLKKGDGAIWVTCRIPGRGTVGTSFPTSEFESRGRAWIKAQLSRQHDA